MNETKSLFASKTFWGVVVALAAPFAARYGFEFEQASVEALTSDIVGVIGGLFAIYGRIVASKQVG